MGLMSVIRIRISFKIRARVALPLNCSQVCACADELKRAKQLYFPKGHREPVSSERTNLMFQKITVIIDSRLRRELDNDPELGRTAGFQECLKLVSFLVCEGMFEYRLHHTNPGISDSNLEFVKCLASCLERVVFNVAKRIEVIISRPNDNRSWFDWNMKFYRPNEKKDCVELSCNIHVREGLSRNASTMGTLSPSEGKR